MYDRRKERQVDYDKILNLSFLDSFKTVDQLFTQNYKFELFFQNIRFQFKVRINSVIIQQNQRPWFKMTQRSSFIHFCIIIG